MSHDHGVHGANAPRNCSRARGVQVPGVRRLVVRECADCIGGDEGARLPIAGSSGRRNSRIFTPPRIRALISSASWRPTVRCSRRPTSRRSCMASRRERASCLRQQWTRWTLRSSPAAILPRRTAEVARGFDVGGRGGKAAAVPRGTPQTAHGVTGRTNNGWLGGGSREHTRAQPAWSGDYG